MVVGNDAKKFFQIGAKLPQKKKEELVEFLKRNTDVFAWDAYDTLRIDLSLHLPPPQCQPLHYPQKAVTPTPI